MKRKFINVTKEYIENLAPTDFCVELIQPAWETVNIYGSYEEYEESLKPYTTEQRYLLAMHWLGAEVDNGGFQQFLGNSTGIVWEDAYKGYQAIGSEKLAYLIEELIKIYGRDIPFDREERGNILDSFSQEKLAEIDAITDLYYEIEEPEWRKVALNQLDPKIKKVLLDGLGHELYTEAPEIVAREINNWLQNVHK